MKNEMLKKLSAFLVMAMMICLLFRRTEVYADEMVPARPQVDHVNENLESDNSVGTDKAERDMMREEEDFSEKDNASLLCNLICFGAVAGLLIMIAICSREKTDTLEMQKRISGEYDQNYDQFKRYYAYCSEQIRKVEKQGPSRNSEKVQDKKEEVLDIYSRMTEEKHQFDAVRNQNTKEAMRKKEAICNKSRHHVAKLQNCLVYLKDINKTYVL